MCCVFHSADERFDATFHTNVLVSSNGACQYLPPGNKVSYIYLESYDAWGTERADCRIAWIWQLRVDLSHSSTGSLTDRVVTKSLKVRADSSAPFALLLHASCAWLNSALLKINQCAWELMFQKLVFSIFLMMWYPMAFTCTSCRVSALIQKEVGVWARWDLCVFPNNKLNLRPSPVWFNSSLWHFSPL